MRAPGESVDIRGGDASKIVRVLRLRDGDAIEIVDSAGGLYPARIAVHGSHVVATLGPAGPPPPIEPTIDLAQALPKAAKMELVVEKATELGASAIVPFRCERTVAQEPSVAKLARWQAIAATAAAQSGRRFVPPVAPVEGFAALLARFDAYDCVLFAWELAPPQPLREHLGDLLRDAARVLLVVGPEGGFAHHEAEAAAARGAALLWLGPRILRTETVALALLAIVGSFGPEVGANAS